METRYPAVATTMVLASSMAQAQSIGAVENARAKERQGSYLSPQDRDMAISPGIARTRRTRTDD